MKVQPIAPPTQAGLAIMRSALSLAYICQALVKRRKLFKHPAVFVFDLVAAIAGSINIASRTRMAINTSSSTSVKAVARCLRLVIFISSRVEFDSIKPLRGQRR